MQLITPQIFQGKSQLQFRTRVEDPYTTQEIQTIIQGQSVYINTLNPQSSHKITLEFTFSGAGVVGKYALTILKDVEVRNTIKDIQFESGGSIRFSPKGFQSDQITWMIN